MTDIFATLGPACSNIRILQEMLRAGMTGLRLNLNHGRLSDTAPLLTEARKAALFCGIKLKILTDMQGRSLRVGTLPTPVVLKDGEEVFLGRNGIPVPSCMFKQEFKPKSFSMSDGRILLDVLDKESDRYRCFIRHGGLLESRKGFIAIGAETKLPALTEQDTEAIRNMKEAGVCAVMIPFTEDKEQLISVRKSLDECGCREVKIWAKLENMTGLDNIDDWLPYADMCVIARGDLGNCLPLESIPACQKKIALKCIAAGTPFLVATGFLRSLMHEQQPSRADISDIFNAVLDGASGLMLTDETALGARPVKSIEYLCKTAAAACELVKSF